MAEVGAASQDEVHDEARQLTALSTYAMMSFITSLKEAVMSDIRPSTDVLPVTEFRAKTSALLMRLRASKRPIVLTQHGRSAAVLMNVEVYEDMLDEIALLRDIRVAEEQIARGEGIPHDESVAELRARLAK
jgi:antitoxin YefM